MQVLVIGGTGVIGPAAVGALVADGHRVRLASRHAADEAAGWGDAVEADTADIGEDGGLDGAVDGCDAVLHIAGILTEDPPEVTYERINIHGTRRALAEAERAGARRFVFVSSLGAERGASEYHRSKREAEQLVEAFAGKGTIVRLANVYGPGDDAIPALLAMVRSMPAVPVIGGGDQPFEPIWHEDAGEALARIVARDDLGGRAAQVGGSEPSAAASRTRRGGPRCSG